MSSILQNVGKALAGIAPVAAGMFGGPLAATAVTQVESWLGITPNAGTSLDDRAAAIQNSLATATPDQIITLKKADDELKAKMIDGGIQLAQIDASDRASARALEATTRNTTPTVLTYLLMLACAGVAGVIVGGYSPAFKDPTMAATVGTIVGYLFGELKAATSYWFGSSTGSEQKNSLINKALDASPPSK